MFRILINAGRFMAFVQMSASILLLSVLQMSMNRCSCASLRKWCLSWMNFRFFVGAVLHAAAMAAALSIINGVGVSGRKFRKASILLSSFVVWTAVVAATYSASQVERAVIPCFAEYH